MGVAIFHAEGYRTADFFTGQKKSTGMAIFSVGVLFGGPLAHRWDHKNFFLITMGISFGGFLKLSGWPVIVILGLCGLVLYSTFSVSIVMVQAMLPQNLGVAPGLMVGFAN